MSQPVKIEPTVNAEELTKVLEKMLGKIVGMEIRPYAYRSSFALEEIDVRLADGTQLEILFKDLSRHALLDEARQVKPSFLYDPLREIDCYRSILSSCPMGTAAFYGAVVDEPAGRYWLLLEKVKGLELYQVGEIRLWQEAARWLAQFHQRFASSEELGKLSQAGRWLTYDEKYYRHWPERAATLARNDGARQKIDRLASCYEAVIQRLISLPVTFIHGEFYPSNILVSESVGKVRICPVDWEMAAIGPGLIDLAALTAGNWPDQDRDTIAFAYYEALPAASRPMEREFLTDLAFCRLHLSLQWLGWSADWKPPAEHAKDWLGEALRLAHKLGLLEGSRQ
ncbi:MAG TPA: aminoglycoside phosphotransferase family protein [Gemmataceae bacterium]|nr:aminoglycoside phosphotransferase family protein [Gemmataceae bacterium]